MKISYCAHAKIPSREANSIHVMKMCYALSQIKDVVVELIVPKSTVATNNPYEFYGVDNTFKIHYKRWPRVKAGVLLYSLSILLFLLKDRKQWVYGRDLTTCFFSSVFGFRTIWESHTPVSNLGKFYEFLFKLMVRQRSLIKIVVISNNLKSHYVNKYKIDNDRIIVLPDCSDVVDLSKNCFKPMNNKGRNFSVGYIGQLYPGKGMEIISQLIPLCKDVMFHIVGGNDSDIEYWKKRLGNEDNILFHGFVKPADIPLYGMNVDALIAPYLNKVQGAGSSLLKNNLSQWMSPLKLFEYMSYKKPIIASDLPVLHDVLHSGNSLMCNPDNIDEWCRAIHLLSANKELRLKLAECAYTEFLNNYTWIKRAERIVSIYTASVSNNIDIK